MRRDVVKRVEDVLLRDNIRAPIESVDVLLSEVKKVLENYMKVYDMHMYFKKSEGGMYTIKIDGKVSHIRAPKVF